MEMELVQDVVRATLAKRHSPPARQRMNLSRRNYPPDHGIRMPFEDLKQLVVGLFEKVNMPPEDADLLASILVGNNQRCLYSHGTGQIPYYLQKIKDGAVNPRPDVTVDQEAGASLVMDGDGGLGYFPCYRGTLKIIEKAKAGGVAALTTRNHQHVGSAGNYTRLALEHDCIGISGSSQKMFLDPNDLLFSVVDTSPSSIAIPAGEQPPIVMDMGGALLRFEEELFKRIPTTYLKIMALTAAVRALAGVFPGIYRPAYADSQWEAGQGAFIAVVDVAHFMPLEELKREMDRFVGDARATKPLPGMPTAELAGGNEWVWAKDNQKNGIPLNDDHCAALQEEADKLGVETPFANYEHTRF